MRYDNEIPMQFIVGKDANRRLHELKKKSNLFNAGRLSLHIYSPVDFYLYERFNFVGDKLVEFSQKS